jgi:tetratricopeptide (TPR) repeat protein
MPEPVLSFTFLHARSRVEIGRVLLCLTLNGDDRADEARVELEAVIEEYRSESRLADLIGEAHQALGFYYSIGQNHDAAIAEYRRAIDVTNEESRRAVFHIAIASIDECFLDDPEAAFAEIALSDALVPTPLQRPECSPTTTED